uniref:Fungal-type protein kinase domain-containing protein n=1 Tax=Ganoderma boninense TaxID=34458 RepID=A0A5K1JWT6_9APHY|nr:Uncharacterized protein [Ganoderma boninense]
MALGNSTEHTPCSARKLPSVIESVGEVELDQYRAKAAEDMANCAIHADTITEFLDELLPWPLDGEIPVREPLDENPFKLLENADDLTEDAVTDFLANIIVKYNLAPGLKLCRSEHLADSKDIDKTGQKIDAGLFHAADAPDDGCPHWALQLLAIELKSRLEGRNHNDPYDDTLKDGSADATAESRTRVRGQTTTYSELSHAIQHRTALFMLIVIGRRFRVTRWDRAGTIVTTAIDYYEHPDALCDFLWRVAHLSDEALGLDPSAVRLHEKDAGYKTMDRRASPCVADIDCSERVLGEKELANVDMASVTFSYVRELFADSISGDWPRYKLRVGDGDAQRWFYVGKPLFIAPGMAGRGTKGWVGLDVARNRFVFIKDSWRAAYDELEREGDILLKLNRAGVPNVPTLVCHGDVDEQMTRTAQWWADKHPARKQGPPKSQSVVGRMKRKREPGTPQEPREHDPAQKEVPEYAKSLSFRYDCPIRVHRHYRLVLAEVCRPLKEFAYGRQLITVLHDVVSAHQCAATHPDLKILHRDIGGGNILLYPKIVVENDVWWMKWSGVLIDWEVSRPIVKEGTLSIPRQPERTHHML